MPRIERDFLGEKELPDGAYLSVAVIAVLGVLVQTSTAGTATYQYKWRMNQTHPADSPFGTAAEAFAAEVRQRTNGNSGDTILRIPGTPYLYRNSQ